MIAQVGCSKAWLTCTKCPLHKKRKRVVLGYGNIKADLMLIGEGPGGQEDVSGLPFVGRAGEMLTAMLSWVGIRRQDVFIDNLVGCRPTVVVDDRVKDRPPTKKEWAACRDRLYDTIYEVDPLLIVTLGGTAFQYLTGLTGTVTGAREDVHILPMEGQHITVAYPLIATYHPSYLCRNAGGRSKTNSVWNQAKQDLTRAVTILDELRQAYGGFYGKGRDDAAEESV